MLKKRALSLFLCLCMVVGMLPAITPAAQAAGTGVADRLNQLRTSYPDYQYWYRINGVNKVTSTPCPHRWDKNIGLIDCGAYNSGWQCWAFASKLFYDVFGQNPNVYGDQRKDKENIRVGDYVRYSWPNDKTYGHSFLVLSVSGSRVTAVECNTEEGNCRIRWDRGSYDLNSGMKGYDSYGNLTNFYFDYYCRATNYDDINGSSAMNLGNDFYAYIRSNLGTYLSNDPSNAQTDTVYGNAQTASRDLYDPRQIWHFTWDSSKGSYKITNMYDRRCLDVDNGRMVNGTNIGLCTDFGQSNQRWKITGDSPYLLRPVDANGYALDVYGGYSSAGTNVVLWSSNEGDKAQQFYIDKISTSTVSSRLAFSRGNDFYARISNNGYYLQTSGTRTFLTDGWGMNVELTNGQKYDPRQIWHFIRQGNGSYKIVNEYSNCSLDVQGGQAANTRNVWTWYDDVGQSSVRWYLMYSDGDPTYRLVSAIQYPGALFSIDIPGGNLREGANIELYQQNAGWQQYFSITTPSYTRPSAPSVPASIRSSGPPERTVISWSSVPEQNAYDSREYEIVLRDSSNNIIASSRQTTTSYTCPNLPVGSYSVAVRAINTKYPNYSSNYSSAYITQSFEVYPSRTLSLVAIPASGGTVIGGGVYAHDAYAVVIASANDGYHFVKWVKNGIDLDWPFDYGFRITEDVELTAVFEPDIPAKHIVSVSSDPVGGGTVTGGDSYDEGASVTVTATANEGYQFKNWTEGGHAVSSDTSYSFTATGDRTLTAVFAAIPVNPEPEPEKYTVNVSANPVMGGTVTGNGSYVEGTSITVTAIPNSGYQFEGWQENGSLIDGAGNKYTFSVSGNRTLTAVFKSVETPSYVINVRATAGGTASGGGIYEKGKEATVTATPSDGYRFVHWTEDDNEVSMDRVYSFTVSEVRTLTAVFEANDSPTPILSYTVEVDASPAAGGTVTGGDTYMEGASVTVTAVAKSGYRFMKWIESGNTVSAESSYTFSAESNRTLTAVFEAETLAPTPTYTISVSANPAAYGTVTGGDSYEEGTLVTISATPNSGYQFVGWQLNGQQISTTASYTFSANADQTFIAVFEPQPELPPATTYTITLNATEGGAVSGSGPYVENCSVTIRAIPDSGYRFVEWQLNGVRVSTDANYTFPASANQVYTAIFAVNNKPTPTPTPKPTYTIQVNADPASAGTVTGGDTFTENTSVTVTATPNDGYKFIGWLEGGITISTTANYTFTVKGNRTLTAVFEPETSTPTYVVSVNADLAEGGSVSGDGVYPEGAPVTITANPNDGYKFVEWRLDGLCVNTSASYTFTASANQTYTAVFEKISTSTPPEPTPVTHTVSVSANPTAGGSVTGGGSFTDKTSVTVTAVPNNGYRFTGWKENGYQVSADHSYTFAISSDRTLIAEFSYIGGNSPSGSHDNSNSTSGSASVTPSVPVNTSKISNSTTTTATPSVSVKGGVATSTITSAIANEIIKQTVSNNSDRVAISPDIKGNVTKVMVTIPGSALEDIGRKTEAGLIITNPLANVVFTNGGLSGFSGRDTVTVTTERTENILEVSVIVGKQIVKNIQGGIDLTVPITQGTLGTVAVLVHDDGTRQVIRKSVANKQVLTVSLPGSAKLEIIDNAKHFEDVPAENWAADAVAFVSAHELFNGTSGNTFSPNSPMTRGMLAVVLHNLENNPKQSFTAMFSDVPNEAWYSEAVIWTAGQNIVSGYGNGNFGPGDNITREQLAVILWRYAGSPEATQRELRFIDAGNASEYAKNALCWAVENGIINGKSNDILDPQGLATRAQVAQMLKNYICGIST